MSSLVIIWRKLGLGSRVFSTLAVMSLGSVVMLLVATVTLFQARRLYSELLAKQLGRIVLWVWKIRLEIQNEISVPEGQVIYISNHSSTMDLFVLISLGLPNTRFFLSGYLRKIIPLGIMGYILGIFYTCSQSMPEKRIQTFQRADRILRRTKESVYLSPEGTRITTGEIGHFNKGAFHLATNLQVPIVPMYIKIPRNINPGKGWSPLPGTVEVHFKPVISTEGWILDDLGKNRDFVRNQFVKFHDELCSD